MVKPIIGIIGASGVAGKISTEILLGEGYKLWLISQDIERLKKVPSFIKGSKLIEVCYEVNNLSNIFRECDIILNCSGPAALYQEKIIEACILAEVNYIDISGGKKAFEKIKSCNAIRDYTYILGCGTYPGLTELFPIYLIEKAGKRPKEIIGHIYNSGSISYSAAYDLCYGILSAEGKGMVEIHNNKIQKIQSGCMKKSVSEINGKKIYAYPIISCEFETMVLKYKFQSALFYNLFSNLDEMGDLVLIKREQNTMDEMVKKYVTKVNKGRKDAATEIIYSLVFGNEGQTKREFMLKSRKNASQLSGIVGALTVKYWWELAKQKTGLYHLFDFVDSIWMIEQLVKQGVIIDKIVSNDEGCI